MIDFYKMNKDIIYVIGIHILMPIVYCFIFISTLIVPLLLFLNEFSQDIENPLGLNIKTFVFIFFCIFIMFLFILRLCILPCVYGYFEKKSNNIRLKNFIHNLKHNYLYRLLILIIIEIPFLILVLRANTVHYPPYLERIELHALLTCTCDLLGCYLVLFLWWDIQKFIKKIKNKT